MLHRSATAPRKRNAPRPAWKVAEAFRKWLRGRPCACKGRNPDCGGDMVAAHVDHAGGKGMQTKVADRHCIPLTDRCHMLQHNKGWPWFEREVLRGSAVTLAAEYWKAWPGRTKWENDHAR